MANRRKTITETGPKALRGIRNPDLYPVENNPIDINLSLEDLQLLSDMHNRVTLRDYNSAHGHLGYNVLNDPATYEPQRVPELANSDYGQSVWDEPMMWGNVNQGDIQDTRAENQPWYSKLVNGIGKGGVLAVTTALETAGLLYGIGQGIGNAIAFDSENDEAGEGNVGGAFLHGLWDNPITNALQAINEASEEYMPNYYTRDEQENPFGNIFTANFLGDKILKNLGFMVGAFYGGIPMAKGIGKLGTTAVKNARNEYQALRSGMAAGIRDARAAAAGDTGVFNRLLEARHLTEAERGERLKEGLEKINKIANTTRATTQVIGALGSAINEGAIEAINNSKDWAEAETRKENDRYQQKLAEIDLRYDGFETPEAVNEKIKEAEEHELRLAEIEKGRAAMGNADLLMNIPILTYSNMLQLGKLYTRGFDSTRRRMGSIWNGHKLSGSAAEGTLKTDKTWKGAVARGLRNSLSEGTEEYLQRSASDAAGNEVMASIDRYVNSGKSEDSKIGLDNYIAGFGKAVADNAGNPQAWEEFMIGALSSMVGMPVFGSQTKNAYMKLGPVGFAGGMVGSYKDYMAEKKHESDVANYINGRVKDPKFKALYDYLRKSEDYEQALMTALENNDKEEYKNLEAEKLFEDINAFASAGHLEEFKQLIGFNEDYDATELADIVKNTRKPISAAQQKQRDTDRLRSIESQLAQMDTSSKEEDTSALDTELNNLRKEISVQNKLLRRASDDNSKYNISQELSRLNQRYDELSKQRKTVADNNMQVAAIRKQKEELEKERTAVNARLAGEYKDMDEGEFVQMVNGVPIGMDTMPDVDEQGNPIAGTEGNEMRRILDRNRQKLLKGINDYLRIRDNIDVETDGRLDDNEISLLTKMKMQVLDKEARSLEMADDLAEGLRPVQDIQKKAKERADKAVEKAKDAHTVALGVLNAAKANKTVSPETIATLEKDVVKAENDLKTAEKGARAMDNAISLLGMIVGPRETTRRERRALDKGYGRNEEGDTYSDLYDNSKRNITSDEAQSLLSNPINAIALSEIVNMEGNNLSDAEKQKYINEIWSLSSIAHDKKAYNDQLRKFMKDPSLINQAMSDANMRMTQKEIDNKSDELALRIRRAKDMVELDSIMRGSQIAPEVAQQALQKAKQDGDDNFKTWVSDYEKARGFFDAFNSKVGKYPGWLQEAIANNASVAWNDALMDNSNESKYDKFISLLNEYADEIEKAGDKEQAKAIKDAVKELSDAANATTTNSSSSVRTPSSSSSSSSSTGSSASGTTGTGSSAGSARAVPKNKVLKQIDYKIGMKLRKGQIISSIDELEEVKTTVENYNRQNPDDQITDDYIKQRVEELSNETLNDDESAKDSGSTLSEEDYKNEKSSRMRGHLRITFKGDGVTEYRVYEGDKGAVLLESKEDYSRSEIAEAIHQILKDTHAYDFLSHNYLGYLQQSLAAGESITVHLLRPKNDKIGNKVFLAIEWTPAVARAIKRTGFGTDSEVTIPDTSIEAVNKDGNSKKYQIIGDLSILDEDSGMDPGIVRAFNEVVDAVNEEVNPVLESTDAQWAVSSLTSEVDTIYTGRLVKKSDMKDSTDRKIGLDELVTTSAEWNGEEDFQFGVVTNGKVDHEDNEVLEEPNPAWVQKNPGAILLFVPKPDGRLYPIRCTRRTVAEWYNDADGEAKLDKVLQGTLDNEYLEEVVDTLRKLMSPDTAYGDRVNAKMSLKKYFVLGSGGKKVAINFEGDVVRVSFDEASHRKHTITVDKNNIDGAVKEFFELLRKEDIPFSIPLPTSSDISGKSIISSGIFKIGLKDFYNFNPSFTVAPIDRNGKKIQPEVPESEREHFAGSTRTRPNSYVLNLGSGDVLYHQDTNAPTPTFYKSKVDKSGNPVGAVEKVTDSQELLLVSNAVAIIQEGSGEEAMPIMLNALMPGPSFKDRKDAFKEILADSWGKVYLIRTPDGVWYFDNRSSSHSKVKLFKQGSPLAEALKKEFEEDVKRHDDEVTKKLMEGGSKPKPGPAATGSTGAPAGSAAGTTNSSAAKIADIVAKLKEATQEQPRSKNADWNSVIKDLQAIKVSIATTLDELDNQIYNVFNKYDVGKYWNNLDSYLYSMGISRFVLRSAILSQLTGNAGTTAGTQTGGSSAGKAAGTTGSGGGNTGGQEGKVLVGKDLKSFKSDAPRVVQLLKDRKTEEALDDYIDTIYKDLQTLEAMGKSVLGDDVIAKINELMELNDDEIDASWQEFVEKKKC